VTPTRVRKDSVSKDWTTRTFTAAAVMHEASWSLAPQLHTHVTIRNLRLDPYGGRVQLKAERRQVSSILATNHPETDHGRRHAGAGRAAVDCDVNAGNGRLTVELLFSVKSALTDSLGAAWNRDLRRNV